MRAETGEALGGALDDLAEEVTALLVEFGALWFVSLVMPWRAYRDHVAPRDQSRAARFAVGVTVLWAAMRAVAGTLSYPVLGGIELLSAIVWVAVLIVALTVAVHLMTAIVTVLVLVLARDRGTVSETVQAVAFSLAPMVVVAVPVTAVQALATVWATLSMVYGIHIVHGLSLERSLLVAAVPAYLLFWMGFGGEAAVLDLLRAWYII